MYEIDIQVSRLVKWLNTGLIESTVLIGTNEVLKTFHKKLIDKLPTEPCLMNFLDFSANEYEINITNNLKEVRLIIVRDLEQLSPLQDKIFSLRTWLDSAKHEGYKSIIFCEEDQYTAHFKDRDAPFYNFCLCTHLSTE
jgi:hypothetical protein